MASKNRLLIPCVVLLCSHCLDVSLRDELNWPDGALPDTHAGDASFDALDGYIPGPDGSWIETGVPDTTPPWLVPAAACAGTETALENLCLASGPYGISIRLWASEPVSATARIDPSGVLARSPTTDFEHHLLLAPLAPDELFSISISIEDLVGHSVSAGPVEARTDRSIAPIVVNEVLHDPLGAEPHQEFVELVNRGTSSISIDGWTLADDGGSDWIVHAAPVPAGAYVVIVSDGYQPGIGGDPAPAPGSVVVRLDGAIGAQGLRNSGEPLTLSSSTGEVVSSFPALMSPPGPGISIERVNALGPDGDPANWCENPAGRSSPGRANAASE